MSGDVARRGGGSASTEAHRVAAVRVVRCAVLTISDTRTAETDTSGQLIHQLLAGADHEVVAYRIVRDDPDAIRSVLAEWAGRPDVQAMLSNGGTGIASRDTTYDVIVSMLDKQLDGFGELFRMLSFEEIGAAAMLTRAVGGVVRGRALFAMPGSTNAVRLAMERLIIPELAHVVYEIGK